MWRNIEWKNLWWKTLFLYSGHCNHIFYCCLTKKWSIFFHIFSIWLIFFLSFFWAIKLLTWKKLTQSSSENAKAEILFNFLSDLFAYSPCKWFYRGSHPVVFCQKVVLENFAKLTGKHLCQSLFFNKVGGLSWRLWQRCFPLNFAKFLGTPFFIEYLRWLLLNMKL